MAGKIVLAILFGLSVYGVISSAFAEIDTFSFDSNQVLNFGDY
ncbi:MAG TPA: hypothetical protein VKS78_13390 [Roseiarcus sp.]|nr:hypothetical protein [Roseiarcus sp.]